MVEYNHNEIYFIDRFVSYRNVHCTCSSGYFINLIPNHCLSTNTANMPRECCVPNCTETKGTYRFPNAVMLTSLVMRNERKERWKKAIPTDNITYPITRIP